MSTSVAGGPSGVALTVRACSSHLQPLARSAGGPFLLGMAMVRVTLGLLAPFHEWLGSTFLDTGGQIG